MLARRQARCEIPELQGANVFIRTPDGEAATVTSIARLTGSLHQVFASDSYVTPHSKERFLRARFTPGQDVASGGQSHQQQLAVSTFCFEPIGDRIKPMLVSGVGQFSAKGFQARKPRKL